MLTKGGRYLLVPLLFLGVMSTVAVAQDSGHSPNTLVLEGSTTVAPILINLQSHLYTRNGIKLEVKAVNSSWGIRSVGEKVSDIGMSSRKMMRMELDKWPNLKQVTIGYDVIAIIVNNNNPVESLTKPQIRGIYTGKFNDWLQAEATLDYSDMGDRKVVLISKSTGHGTLDSFISLLEFAPTIKVKNSQIYFKENDANQHYSNLGAIPIDSVFQAATLIQKHPGAIAYESLGSLHHHTERVGKLPVKILGVDGYTPTPKNVREKRYTLVRPLNLIFNLAKKHPHTDILIAFLLSPEGQQLISQYHYLPVN